MIEDLTQLMTLLHLKKMPAILDRELTLAQEKGISYSDFLARLLREEFNDQQARATVASPSASTAQTCACPQPSSLPPAHDHRYRTGHIPPRKSGPGLVRVEAPEATCSGSPPRRKQKGIPRCEEDRGSAADETPWNRPKSPPRACASDRKVHGPPQSLEQQRNPIRRVHISSTNSS